MRKYSIFIAILLVVFTTTVHSQIAISYHENFESPSLDDSVTAVPINSWDLSATFASEGTYSDSAAVITNDTVSLITDAFSTQTYPFVRLEFDQICKIEFFDAAEIFVSADNGQSWTKLTTNHYKGSSQFGLLGNKFSSTSYVDWETTNNFAIPTNAWWKSEAFDISSIAANSSQVKIKFSLSDGNGTGASNNYGWLIDNIKVISAISEIDPPQISLQNPIIQDTVYNTGPFTVNALIQDSSGLDTALLVYNRTGQSTNDTIGMINAFGNVYTATIDTFPPFSITDTVFYKILAYDASLLNNLGKYPSIGFVQFYIDSAPPPPGCSSFITSFPLIEDFDSWPTGSTSCSATNPTANGWTNETTDGMDWSAISGSTGSTSTGPTSDHTSGSGKYIYTEASGCNNTTAILSSPCLDIRTINTPYLEFYYHMYGSTMGSLDINIWYGNQWVNIWSLSGDQGNEWHKASINLSQYKSKTKIQFVAITGSNYYSDIAVDDVKIWQPPANDAGIVSLDNPTSPANTGTQDVKVSFKNFGSDILNKLTLNYEVDGVLQTPFTWTGSLASGLTADSIAIGTYNFASGPTHIKTWTSSPNDSVDGFNDNDTLSQSIIACTGPISGVFSVGTPASDFNTINEALFALQNCGINGPVTINIASGTYTGQITVPKVMGASSQNTITLKSANNDSTSVIIEYEAQSSVDNYVLGLDSADFYIFRNLTIKPLGSLYAYAIVLANGAHNNVFRNNIIEMPTSNPSSSAGFYSTSSDESYNIIENNKILNGYYGIRMAASSSAYGQSNQIINNEINGFRYYGVYLQYQDSLIFNGNTIINQTSSTNTTYSVYLYYLNSYYEVISNNVNVESSSTLYGIRLYYSDAQAAKKAIVANNMINLRGTSSNAYGFYAYNSSYVNYLFNTIVVNIAQSTNSRAFYLSQGSTASINMINNIFVNLSNGTLLYVYSPTAIDTIDYNLLYTTGPDIGYWSGLQTSFADWKSSTGQSANSINFSPNFVAADDIHIADGSMQGSGLAIPSIQYDIDGELRDQFHPAIGADEKPPIPFDAGVVEIINPNPQENEADSAHITLRIYNFGLDTLSNITYSYSLNGQSPISQNYTQNLYPGQSDTVQFPKIYIDPGHNNICAYTTVVNDTNDFNDTLCKYFYGVPKIDMGVTEILSPDSADCFTANEELKVIIKNFGSEILNMSQNPVTISTEINAPITINIPDYVINSGTLAVGASQTITLSSNLDMDHTGIYDFKIWTSVSSDGDATNDTLKDKQLDVFATVKIFPYVQDFENFDASTSSSDPGVLKEGWKAGPSIVSENCQWFVGSGMTPAASTGPAFDNTTKTPAGKYLYAESIGYYGGDASIIGPCIDLSNMSNPTLRFFYHMFGANIHSIRVDVYSQGIWHSSEGHLFGQHHSSNTDDWNQYIVDLSKFANQVIKLRFRAIKAIGYASNMAIDDIYIYEPMNIDAGIAKSFVQPSLSYTSEGSKIDIEVKIENLGIDTLTQMQVGYSVNGGIAIIETWTGSLPPYSGVNYKFNTKYEVKAGEVQICAFTKQIGDVNTNNDTSCIAFVGVPVFELPYSDDFEAVNYWVSEGSHGQWVRANPNKSIFNSARSGSNVWITESDQDYYSDAQDYLYSPFFDFSKIPDNYLTFYHKLDSEVDDDGGRIEYSDDGGQLWIPLGYMGDPNATNWYNTNIGGSHYWTGQDTSNWVESKYLLSIFNQHSQPIQFRYVFSSDNDSYTGEGWMIDDFKINPALINRDAGVSRIISPNKYTNVGSTNFVSIMITNHGLDTLYSIPVYYQIDNNSAINETWTGTLPPQDSTAFDFVTTYSATAAYDLEASTNLSGDTYSFNDSKSIRVNKDVGVDIILEPLKDLDFHDSVDVIVHIKNYGFDTISTFDLSFSIAGNLVATETWNGVLPPNQAISYTFNTKLVVPYGMKNLCVTTNLTDDDDLTNDEKCKYIVGYVGIENAENNEFSVEQNIPNPFTDQTQIRFKVEKNTELVFELTDLTGRLIHKENIKAKAGENTFNLSAEALSSGFYFYTFRSDYKKITKKLIIIE